MEDGAGRRPRPRLAAFFDLGHSAACDGFDNLLPLAEERAGAEQMAEAVKWAARRYYSLKNSRKKRYSYNRSFITDRYFYHCI